MQPWLDLSGNAVAHARPTGAAGDAAADPQPAGRAVDGGGGEGEGNCSSTGEVANPWWWVALDGGDVPAPPGGGNYTAAQVGAPPRACVARGCCWPHVTPRTKPRALPTHYLATHTRHCHGTGSHPSCKTR